MIWLHTLRFHIIFDRCFFWEWCLPWHSVHHLLSPVWKCNNVRDPNEIPDFWAPNSPDLNTVDYKIWGSESARKKVQDVNDLKRHLFDVWVGVKQSVIDDGIDQWRRLLNACIRATRGHFEYSSWHKIDKPLLTVINYNLLLNETFCLRLTVVSWHTFHKVV